MLYSSAGVGNYFKGAALLPAANCTLLEVVRRIIQFNTYFVKSEKVGLLERHLPVSKPVARPVFQEWQNYPSRYPVVQYVRAYFIIYVIRIK